MGAKVTGSMGNYGIGVMEVNTRGPARILGKLPCGTCQTIAVGWVLHWRDGHDKASGNPGDSYNQALGADTRLVFWRDLVVRGYAAQTRTPGVSSGQTDLGASSTYKTNWLNFSEHRKIGANFNPEVGFSSATTVLRLCRHRP